MNIESLALMNGNEYEAGMNGAMVPLADYYIKQRYIYYYVLIGFVNYYYNNNNCTQLS